MDDFEGKDVCKRRSRADTLMTWEASAVQQEKPWAVDMSVHNSYSWAFRVDVHLSLTSYIHMPESCFEACDLNNASGFYNQGHD